MANKEFTRKCETRTQDKVFEYFSKLQQNKSTLRTPGNCEAVIQQ